MTSVVLASLLCALPPARGGATPPADQSAPQPLSEDEVQERIDTFMRTIDTRISPEQWRARAVAAPRSWKGWRRIGRSCPRGARRRW